MTPHGPVGPAVREPGLVGDGRGPHAVARAERLQQLRDVGPHRRLRQVRGRVLRRGWLDNAAVLIGEPGLTPYELRHLFDVDTDALSAALHRVGSRPIASISRRQAAADRE
jgi:hypothetical protein